jgi:molybdopterin synthase catalytic subunit
MTFMRWFVNPAEDAGEQLKCMAIPVLDILLTESPLEVPTRKDAGDAGAMIEFRGVVRRLEDSREIEGIEYEAHREMAEHQLKRIVDQAAEKFGLKLATIHHRIGFVAVGEPSLVLAVATSHRSEGFRAAQWIVDELKKKVPIWKNPWFKNQAAVAGVADAAPGSPIPATTNALKSS